MVDTSKQEQRVLAHLKERGSLTGKDAAKEYGIADLRGVIYKLRKQGIAIMSTPVTSKNKFKESVCYMQYSLLKVD